MGKLYSNLHKLYSVSKTLRFELQPIGKTLENMKKERFIEKDKHRADSFKSVKKYCDEYHKKFIDDALKDVALTGLEDYYKYYNIDSKSDKEKKEFKKIQDDLRKQVADVFKNYKKERMDKKEENFFEGLFQAKMIKEYLKEEYKNNLEALMEIEEFNKFTTYFTGYNQNRGNMYTEDEKATAISYRLIHENLPTFVSNMKIYQKIKGKIPDISSKVCENLEEISNADEVFELNYYNNVLTQKGIEKYNLVISGKAEDSNKKVKGLNELINEYNQKYKEKLPKLKELYKQILSDRESTSFIFDILENDEQTITMIEEYLQEFLPCIDKNAQNNFVKLMENLTKYNTDKIYINNDLTFTNLSKQLYGDHRFITSKIEEKYDNEYTGKQKRGTDKYVEARDKYIKSMGVFSLEYINEVNQKDNKVYEYFKNNIKDTEMIKKFQNNLDEYNNIKSKYQNSKKELIKNETDVAVIKNLLDSMKAIQDFAKILMPKDNTLEIDDSFYSELYEYYKEFVKIIPVYNKARNYLTQKPYSEDKIKINFECPTLLKGWDISKETTNLGVILLKDEKYYLGIMAKKGKKSFEQTKINDDLAKNYKKMEYKQLSNPVRDLLHKTGLNKNGDMFNKKGEIKPSLKKYNIKKDFVEKYANELYKNDIEFCRELIDLIKRVLREDDFWGKENIEFADTSTYNSIGEFYKELEEKATYKIEYKDYDEDYIDGLVERGELYLFEIYNKDFSKYSKGKKNLHTLYWNAVFDKRNLKDVVYKLNGEAEIFYRPKSLDKKKTTIHKANFEIKNKNPHNKKKTSKFTHDIVKNKRYTEDKFLFHVPITLNFKNQKLLNINEIVNYELKYSDDVHVIGIDRGERNLLYICVIDKDGKIVEQKSLNQIINEYNGTRYETDYHELLDKKEKERDEARKSWKTIDNIKELKEGYLSQVIHTIVELMRKYNAIIVLEDLNNGFKNSRIKVEKQVYQKFEKMLIDKLNYLVFKDNEWEQEGGILNAYQLTNKFESFQKLGKQSGVLYYIPAWNTSKMDPTTGFVNLFYVKYESIDKSKEFIRKFEDIRFNEHDNYFEFDIDYTKFTDRLSESKRYWTICTYGERIETFRNEEKNNQWDTRRINLSQEFKKLFAEYCIDINDIQQSMLQKNEKDFFVRFMNLFKLTLQMRNSVIGDMEDYLISPVKNSTGKFFDTRVGDTSLPKDADANGAYNIARKGLMLIKQMKSTDDDSLGKIKYNITNKEWLAYAQDEDNLKWKK